MKIFAIVVDHRKPDLCTKDKKQIIRTYRELILTTEIHMLLMTMMPLLITSTTEKNIASCYYRLEKWKNEALRKNDTMPDILDGDSNLNLSQLGHMII